MFWPPAVLKKGIRGQLSGYLRYCRMVYENNFLATSGIEERYTRTIVWPPDVLRKGIRGRCSDLQCGREEGYTNTVLGPPVVKNKRYTRTMFGHRVIEDRSLCYRLEVNWRCISNHGETGKLPDWFILGFSQVGIVPGDAFGWRVFSGIFGFPGPFIQTLLYTRLICLLSAIKTSLLRANQIYSLTHFANIRWATDKVAVLADAGHSRPQYVVSSKYH
ncbi:hypothetical protein PR048_018794 [Dryococelus australis]|uniref:Uncharacterized protein n=1 Tax=Dryococelus australis TaxID=614101 RepID=A0ABQ9H1S2_9NEOP|nr:hypothetical protein PR048_018794 [Dryococelus australis]